MRSRYTENRFFVVGLWTFLVLIGLVLSPLYAQDYPPDIARGKAVYQRHCQHCHGPTGRGDGPDAADQLPERASHPLLTLADRRGIRQFRDFAVAPAVRTIGE